MKNIRKNILVVIVLIGAFLFFYIRHVKLEREDSIRRFFPQQQIGDIYKIRYKDNSGGTSVRYYRVAEMEEGAVFFFRGRLSAWNVSDVFLDDYDTEAVIGFSSEDLQQIRSGTFSNNEMKNAQLVEIERREANIPQNIL